MMCDYKGREMYLTPEAERAAGLIEQAGGVLLSGYRDPWAQAAAMAANLLTPTAAHPQGNRGWIGQVYRYGQPLQDWVNAHPEAVSRRDLTVGLYKQLLSWPLEAMPLSHHLLRPCPCFDLAVGTDTLRAEARALPGLTQFLENEGGLPRWHCEFGPALPVVKRT